MTPEKIARLVASIAPMLRGHHPVVVSAALADLTSMMLAALRADTPAETERLRNEIIERHVELIRCLIPGNVQMIDERVARGEITPDDIRVAEL